MRLRSRKSLVLALVALGLAVGCAEEREPINRVQPNALPKKFFVGEKLLDTSDDPEFWTQATLTDVGYGASQDGLFTSTYAQPLARVKFVIQEKQLIARLTYERIADSDHKGMGPMSNDGIVVAVFPIDSHFDIQREYNPVTGEEYNVIGENTTDRPWYEREYMRVDFSKNLNTDSYDFDTLSQIGVFGGVKYEPLAYEIKDPTDPDAPHFDIDGGYFDVTNKAFAVPQQIDLRYLGWGIDSFPACFLEADFMNGSAPAGNCNPVELTVRHSFRKVVDRDFEPAHWDGFRFSAFGAFYTDRKGYARNYMMTDDRWYRFINRYNIWERSHAYTNADAMTGAVECFTPDTTPAGADPHRDLNNDGTEDECEKVAEMGYKGGSRCDEFTQKCTLPFRDRKEVTQVWYYTTGSDPNYFDGSDWAAHEWDVALRSAVATARYAECKRTGGTDCETQYPVYHGQQDENEDAVALAWEVDACRRGKAYPGETCDSVADRIAAERGYSDGVKAIAKMPEMIVLCHSPVEANDPAICAKPEQRLPAGMASGECYHARRNHDQEKIATCEKALNARLGDLRYNQVNVIETPQTPSPWGIMVDSVDPYNGQKVATSINAWSYVTDYWSQIVVDTSRYIKGELTTDQITNGEYIKDWSQAAQAAAGGGAAPLMTADQIDQRISDFVGRDVRNIDTQRAALYGNPSVKSLLQKARAEVRSTRADARAVSMNQAKYNARMQRAQGTEFEASLITPMMVQYAGASKLVDASVITQFASPLRAANPSVLRDMRRMRELALAERGACVLQEAPMPLSIANLADALEKKFEPLYGKFNASDSKDKQLERAEAMRKWLAQKVHYSVIIHEMGHSVGLRHNFVSSADPFNYRPQYWQLRTRNGNFAGPCNGLQTTEAGALACSGPRYYDPMTQEEKDNLLWMWMQSSIMDYAGETTQDLLGIGAWDFASARMFYGDVVAVYEDPSYKAGQPRSVGVIDKMDNFGGIVGLQYVVADPREGSKTIHYSQLQKEYELIRDCKTVDPEAFRPATWDEAKQGPWSPLLDGFLVNVGGAYVRCKQQPVDYVQWSQLKKPTGQAEWYRGGPSVDPEDRIRVPYGFATDNWADLGNLSVYRHDNGGDAYELFDFFITSQEVYHVFDNYRRNRHSFSVRGAANRTLSRFNEKMRDGAKGLGLMANIYRDLGADAGIGYDTLWPVVAKGDYADNILASTIAFDHFARQLQRPEAGVHYRGEDGVYYSMEDALAGPPRDAPEVTIPNGAFGDNFRNMQYGGKLLENRLCESCGEYDSEYTMNAGSYYEKLYTAYLMTESVDNFISDSRRDFLDGRYRAVSLADLFPEGYRRWLANNLTNDIKLKGPRIATVGNNQPDMDSQGFVKAIGWTRWTPASGPESCFASMDSLGYPDGNAGMVCAATPPAQTAVVDPQVDWEQHKFLVAFTLLYLPENQQRHWLDMMSIWELGADSDPGFANRIELHIPDGRTYIAKTFGKEVIFGKTVQKGVAARVLEYANELLAQAYEVDAVDYDNDGQTDWYVPRMRNGQPIIKYDPGVVAIDDDWMGVEKPGCNEDDNSQCLCTDNRACMTLDKYSEMPFFFRQAMAAYGLADPSMRGIY